MLEEIRRSAEHRLHEIEPLIEEAERLREVLSAIEHHPSSSSVTSSPNGAADASGQRAPKGANKRIILELIARRPGITPAEIARTTGLKRTVVASTVSRLKRYGELEAHEHGGVRVVGDRSSV
ncbi:MAG TPA: helix-turn-helix domain-containing protein [Solirubrobacteraceae bacterium]|nr:helix-turn-helix domain-containing protein [Solirubrobacteraceae bacterium]